MALQRIEIPVRGMDCAGCCNSVQRALTALPGVEQADVLLAAEKAIVHYDAAQVDVPAIYRAVEGAGYTVPLSVESSAPHEDAAAQLAETGTAFSRSVLLVTAVVAAIVLLVVVVGEWLGWFEVIMDHVPWYIGWLVVLVAWYPILRKVVRATLHGEVISHTLMSIGVVAALAVGQWTTAAIVVLFMRIGDYVEGFTAGRARRAAARREEPGRVSQGTSRFDVTTTSDSSRERSRSAISTKDPRRGIATRACPWGPTIRAISWRSVARSDGVTSGCSVKACEKAPSGKGSGKASATR